MEIQVVSQQQIQPSTTTPMKDHETTSASKSMLSCSSSKVKTNALLGALLHHSKSSCKKQGVSEQDTNDSIQKGSASLASETKPDNKSVSSLVKPSVKENLPQQPDSKKYCSSAQKSLGSSSDSFGSLEELRKELISSVMKALSMDNDSELSLSSISGQTDSTEVHEVFRNGRLNVRGIDLENMLDAEGKTFSVYDLFKARFQQPEYGKAKITNTDVVKIVDGLFQQATTATGLQFIAQNECDYRKHGYDLSKDKNFCRFKELWERNEKRQVPEPNEPTGATTIQDFDF